MIPGNLISKTVNLYLFFHYQRWFTRHFPNKTLLKQQQEDQNKFHFCPKISLIVPVYNPRVDDFKQCLSSVFSQSYTNWEICLCDDGSRNQAIKDIIKSLNDPRIKAITLNHNRHICHASNQALSLATGQYIGFLDHDDYLWPNALFEIVKLLQNHRKTNLIYTDEDKIEANGHHHSEPFFKPDWDPAYLSSINYLTHFVVVKKSLLKPNPFRPGTEGAQDWDLYLRLTTKLSSQKLESTIVHLPQVLYSWRKNKGSTAKPGCKPYAFKNQLTVLKHHLKPFHLTPKPTPYLGLWHFFPTPTQEPISFINFSSLNRQVLSQANKFIVVYNTPAPPKIDPQAFGYLNKKVGFAVPKLINHFNQSLDPFSFLPYNWNFCYQTFPLVHWQDSFHQLQLDLSKQPIVYTQTSALKRILSKKTTKISALYLPHIVITINPSIKTPVFPKNIHQKLKIHPLKFIVLDD